jgi:hypothetical protein
MKNRELSAAVLGALLAACGPVDETLDPEALDEDVGEYAAAVEASELPVIGLGPMVYDQKITRLSPNEVRLSWKTDRPSRSTVNYDQATWRKTVRETSSKSNHSVVLGHLISGSSHRYQIRTVDSRAYETVDHERSFSTASYTRGALPDGWASRDIGSVGQRTPGSARYDRNAMGGAFIVRGTGFDVYHAADSFHFVYRRISGDFELTLKVESWNGYLHEWTKAMTMFRVDLTAGSQMVNQSLNYSGLDYLYFREVAGMQQVDVASSQLNPGAGAPVWARLRRVGDRFTEYFSQDGVNWTVHGPADGIVVDLPRDGYVGFGTCSKDDSRLSEIIYSNVSLRAL